MSQETCLDCYRKHIATAMVFEDEALIGNGYPLHKWLAVGELNAAEKEVCQKYPILASITRDHRVEYQQNNISIPTLELIQLACELEEKEIEEEKVHEMNSNIINKVEEENKSLEENLVN